MRIVLFGGTGMIGQGVLRECLQSSDVLSVLSVGRRRIPDNLLSTHHDLSPDNKLQQVQSDNFAAIDWSKYGDFDACFWCIGVSSIGISDLEYTMVMRDLCLNTIQRLGNFAKRPPALVYISAFGADSTQQSSTHWKRVRGETEQLLLDRAHNSGDTSKPLRDVYIFRPAFVQPLDNVRSSVVWYNWVYRSLSLVTPLLQAVLPGMTSTRNIGRACVHLARQTSYPSGILNSREINRLAEKLA